MPRSRAERLRYARCYTRVRHARRIADGLCADCGAPQAEWSSWYCPRCLADRAQRCRRRYVPRAQRGVAS